MASSSCPTPPVTLQSEATPTPIRSPGSRFRPRPLLVCSVPPPRRHSPNPNQTRLPLKRGYPFSRAPPLLRAPVRLPPLVSAGSRACVRACAGGEWVTWEEETGGRRRRRRAEAGPTTWWSWSTGSSGGTASCSAVADLPSISSRNWDWARFSIAPPKTYCRTLFSVGKLLAVLRTWGISSYGLL